MTRQDLPITLRPYYGYDFNYGTYSGDCFVTDEAKSFIRKCGNYLRKTFSDKYDVAFYDHNSYFTCVLHNREHDTYVYVSISDVRYSHTNHCFDQILVRTMAHAKDWTGGANKFCSLPELCELVDRLAERSK